VGWGVNGVGGNAKVACTRVAWREKSLCVLKPLGRNFTERKEGYRKGLFKGIGCVKENRPQRGSTRDS